MGLIKDSLERKTSLRESNKEEKKDRLLKSGFNLFTSKGVNDTSVQDIAENANVAKGTFYLYFKDKYELRDILIMNKSRKLFQDALKELNGKDIDDVTERIIFLIDYVINELTKNPILVKFIAKDLGWGVFNKKVFELYTKDNHENEGVYKLFLEDLEKSNVKIKNPKVTLFMIIELVSSTCFTSILYNEPLPIKEYKEELYPVIRKIMEDAIVE